MMRIFSILIFSLIVSMASAQDAKSLFSAIGKADIATLSANFSNDMEICIGTEQDFYNKAEATQRIKKFFTDVNPKSGNFKHKGNSKDKSTEYSVGELSTAQGKYRVFIYFEGSKVVGLMFNPE